MFTTAKVLNHFNDVKKIEFFESLPDIPPGQGIRQLEELFQGRVGGGKY